MFIHSGSKEKHHGDAQHAWTPQHNQSCDHNSASPWFLNKVSVQTGSSQVRWPLMGNYTGYANTSCWLPWWQKQGEMKFTQTPEEHGHRGQTCGWGWEEKEVRRTWGLFHLKPLTADQISSKRRDTMVQQLRRGGEVKGWVDQSRLRWMEGWAETNEDGGGKTEMGKKK